MNRWVVFFAGAALLMACAVFFALERARGVTRQVGEVGLQAAENNQTAARKLLPRSASARPLSREFDPAVNPYAGALRQAGRAKRAWDAGFLEQFHGIASNAPVRFELTDALMAAGHIKITQYREGELTYMSGELTVPEPGRFFFLKPPQGGKAGKAVGIIEFEGSKTAYRIEPTGENGSPELWRRQMEEVRCQTMPLLEPDQENELAQAPPLRPDLVPDYVPDYNSNIVSLQSYPGAAGVLLLDFFGGYTPTWGGVTYPRPNVSNAQIKDVWKRVAEDYMPFNINVTTDLRVYLNAPASSRQKCVFSPSISVMPGGAAGVAYIGSWDWGSDTVCWSVYITGKAAAEVGSHEAGHTVGLGHQGTSSSGYFGGHGSGATGWAPIMGTGYSRPVVTWAKGEYQDANNREDELNIIVSQNNNVAYRPDDTVTPRHLELFTGNTAFGEGAIERTGDMDIFHFTTSGGVVSLTANPVGDWANLALSAFLANASGTVIASNNPPTSLSSSIALQVPPGTYTLRVAGAARNNPLTDGFSTYGSLGYYSITGSVAGARLPTRLSVAEHSLNGTLVGSVPAISTNSSFSYAIVSGNTGGTFAIDSRGIVRVANNLLLDYQRLATNTMFPVQFELFVNINDLTNPALNESGRRVVISVLDVNDRPAITGFNALVLEHTQIGTVLGSVTARDADFYDALRFDIVAGDPERRFAIDQTGAISVAGELDAAAQSVYTLSVAVADDAIGNSLTATGSVRVTVLHNQTWFRPGSISYAAYDGIGSGNDLSVLTTHARFPRDPTSERQMPSFEAPINRADDFGAVFRGYLIVPQAGSYTFHLASDDSSELWFSTTTNAGAFTRIAYINGYTGSRQWNKYGTQQSATVGLAAGQGYYLEARMKEGGGDDNLAVGWRGPATANQIQVIPGMYLAPAFINYTPHLAGFTTTLHQGAYTGAAVGQVSVSDVNAHDTHTFSIISGNSAGLFTIDVADGTLRVANENALVAATPGTYSLLVQVIDSGSPPAAATANAVIRIVPSDVIAATSIQRELWHNIGNGNAVSDLTNKAAFPRRPDALTSLSNLGTAADLAEEYGSRIRAYLRPATSGAYRFFISSDDNSSLLLSTDDNPATARRVAYVPGWTELGTWTAYAQQMSAPITLIAGQRYYIEALQKEGGGGDHVQVAWAGPGILDANNQPATNIIAGSFLSPFDLNYPPQFGNQSLPVSELVPNHTAVGRVTAIDSTLDELSFRIVEGNTNNMFAIDPGTGVIRVLDNTLIANRSITSFPLLVAVQDSGYGGLYPSHSSQATVTINVQPPGSTHFVWTGAAGTNAWSDAGNWGGALPPDGARLTFGFPWRQPNINDQLATAGWVQLTNGGFALSGNPLRVQWGVTNRGDNVWGMNTTLAGAQIWHNASGTFQLAGALTNNGLTFALVANSDFRVAGPISGMGGLSKSGSARLLMQGAHSYTGNTVIASAGSATALEVNGAGDLDIRNSDLVLNGRMDLGSHDAVVGALTGSGTIFANDMDRTLTIGANNHSGSFAGVIQDASSGSGSSLNVVKTGAGTQTFTGASSYSGILVVGGGTLSAANAGALGSAKGGTIVKPGATLALVNNITSTGEPLTLNGDGLNGTGALRNDSGANILGGPLSLGSATRIRTVAGSLTLAGTWNMEGNTSPLTFDLANGTTVSVSRSLSGGGSLIKEGAGLLVLHGTNTYFGATAINQGQLRLGPGGSIGGSPNITLAGGTLDVALVTGGWALRPGQILQGSGAITGPATIRGTLSPGAPNATLSFGANTLLAGTTAMEISKNAGILSNSVVQCYGTLTLGGHLTVAFSGSGQLAVGDSFQLFSAAAFGPSSFATLNLPSLPPDLIWNTSRLQIDGTLSVEPATPPALASGYAAGVLTLSWPADFSGYVLQGQTNPPGQGIGTNWFPVPGVVDNSVSLEVDPNVGSALYRLARP